MQKPKIHNKNHKNKKYVGADDSVCPKHQRNTQRGITLIALIITIIVLLILAIVSIRLVVNNGILGKAESATTTYGTEEEKEQIKIGYSDYQMAKASGEASLQLTVAGASSISGTGPWTVEFSSGNRYTVSTDGTISPASGTNTPSGSNTSSGSNMTPVLSPEEAMQWEYANRILSDSENTEIQDGFGNKIVVPAGFKIKVDEDTNYATHVTEGIVVTDGTNEFVWIPVGNIKTSTTDSIGTQITLGRYLDFTVGATPVQTIVNYSESGKSGNWFEPATEANVESDSGYRMAKDIYAFLSSAESNGGYYLGRYEARTATERTEVWDEAESRYVITPETLTTLTENKDDYIYNYVTQSQAAELSQGMYTNKPFTSDLVNSYAWDTAIMFVENFGGNASYASKTSVDWVFASKGTSSDKISNIYDMASNCYEWSTENYSDFVYPSVYPCVCRGGSYFYENRVGHYSTSHRSGYQKDVREEKISFRPILYV